MTKLSNEWETFKKTSMEISEVRNNVETYRKEWAESLTSLGNILNKNTTHEKGMWDITQGNRQNRAMKIKQKVIRSSIDEMNFNSMMDYIKQYPELQSQKTIDKSIDNVKEKRDEVITAEKAYQEKIKEANVYLNTAKSKLDKTEHELTAFETIKTEGEKQIKEMESKFSSKFRLVHGILPAPLTEAEKESLKLFVFEFDRKIEESRNQLKLLKEDLKEYEKREFKPIVTKKFSAIED